MLNFTFYKKVAQAVRQFNSVLTFEMACEYPNFNLQKRKSNMQINTAVLLTVLAGLSSSCQMYRANFDCPPAKGIPCTSVTDIESMIIETPKGPDVIAGKETGTWKDMIPQLPPGEVRKVWLADTYTDCGCHIEGHYLYINPQSGGW